MGFFSRCIVVAIVTVAVLQWFTTPVNTEMNERTKREHKMFPSENASFSDEWNEMKLSLSRTTSSEKYKKNSADEQWSSFSSRSKIYEFMLGCHQKQRSIENVSSIQICSIHLCAIFLHFPRYVVTVITSCLLTMSTRKLWKFTSSHWVHKCEFN